MIAIPILLSLVLLIVDLAVNRKIYSPGVVFNGITFATLFLYCFMLSNIQQTLSWQTVLLLTMCIMWFNIPVFIGYSLKFKKQNTIENDEKQYRPVELEGKKSSKLDLIFFIVILVIFTIEVIYNRGVPLLWKLTHSSKTYFDFKLPVVHSFFVAFLIGVGAYSLFKKKCYYKWFYLLIPILLVSRGFLVAIIIEGFLVYLITAQNKPKYFWLYIVIVGVVGILAFGLFGNFRTGKDAFLAVAQFKTGTEWIPSSFKWIYAYMCFSISNLNNLIAMTPGFVNFGANSFNRIFSPLKIHENKAFNFLISPNFNVSTFAPSLYIDFGFIGPVAFCMIIGLISVFVYKMMQAQSALRRGYVLMYAVLVYGIVFLYFDNLFFLRQMYLQIFYIIIFLFVPYYIKTIKRRKNTK